MELVRAERWSDARAQFEQLSSSERALPKMLFLHARIAQELGDQAAALVDLKKLEGSLPVLGAQIEAARSRAELEAGPFTAAAQYFERATSVDGLSSAARAWQRAGDLAKARVAVERAFLLLGKSKRARESEIQARTLRAEIALAQKDLPTARGDYHWLALRAPGRPEAEQALDALEKMPESSRLSRAERAERAASLAELGRPDAVERELSAAGPAVAAGRASFLRAFALYAARTDYLKAAELFERAAREAPDDAAHALFFSARSLSRAQLDARAIALYQQIAARLPKSAFAEQASYLAARLHFIAGDYVKALAGYDAYLGRFGKRARSQRDASYERALCLLATSRAKQAEQLLTALAEQSRDRRESTRYEYLAAIARASSGDKGNAVERLSRIAEREPLSFWALAARARLAAQGAALPALVPAGAEKKAATPPQPKLPAAAALLHELGLERDAELAVRESEHALQASYAPNGQQALCELYGELDVATRRYRLAQDAVRREALDVAPGAPNAWAWRCVYPEPYPGLVQKAGRDMHVTASLLFGVMRQESAFDASAASPVGALGLMQLMPATIERMAVLLQEPTASASWRSPAQNLRFGAAYLAKLFGWLGGDRVLAVAAYNAGPDVVYRWLDAKAALSTDLFVAHIPFAETREYVERVLGNEARYAYLSGGEAAVVPLALDLPKGVTRASDAF
ncbi:MAG TPA: transglycosylase SLT domain-containing protein [Polyangiaceae bacterium]